MLNCGARAARVRSPCAIALTAKGEREAPFVSPSSIREKRLISAVELPTGANDDRRAALSEVRIGAGYWRQPAPPVPLRAPLCHQCDQVWFDSPAGGWREFRSAPRPNRGEP